MDLLLVCNPEGVRHRHLVQSLPRFGIIPRVVSYAGLIDDPPSFARHLRPGTLIRLESPGEDSDIERKLILLGAAGAEMEGLAWRLTEAQAKDLPFDQGRILCPRQWFLGFRRLLQLIESMAAEHGCRFINHPEAIISCFDKPVSQQLIESRGIRTPQRSGRIDGYGHLQELVRSSGRLQGRLFLKIANGSSGAAVCAYRFSAGREMLTSHLEIVESADGPMLYLSKRASTWCRQAEISRIIDCLARDWLFAEEWIPKPASGGRLFDFRLHVAGGRTAQAAARLSRSPITNLNIGGRRASPQDVVKVIGTPAWEAAVAEAEKIGTAYGGRLFYYGADVVVSATDRNPYILEVNAFGDHLRHLDWHRESTYETQFRILQETVA